MNKYLWGLILLFAEIILETGLNLESGIVRGLSFKNIFIYGFLMLFIWQNITGNKKPVSPYLKTTNNLFKWYVLYCALSLMIIIISPPRGYDWLLGLGRYKSDLMDATICFFIFMWFTDSLDRAEKMITWLTLIIGLASFATLLDVVASSVSLFGFDEDSRRPNGAFGEPNQTAAVLVLAFPLVLAKVFAKGKLRLIYIGIVVVILAAIASTGSRGGMLGAVAGALLFLWYARAQLSISNKMMAVVTAPILAIVAWLLMPEYYQELLITRLSFLGESSIDYGEASAGRTGIWMYVLNFWFERPIFGWGWAGYQIVGGHSAHSVYLERLADTGLIGFIIFIIIQYKIWRFIHLTMSKVRGSSRILLGGMAAGLAGLYVSLIFVNLYMPAIITWSLTGVMVSYANQLRVDIQKAKAAASD